MDWEASMHGKTVGYKAGFCSIVERGGDEWCLGCISLYTVQKSNLRLYHAYMTHRIIF